MTPAGSQNRAGSIDAELPDDAPEPVGPGEGLVFAPERDRFTWWSEHLILIDGASLPDLERLGLVQWSDEINWQTADTEYLLR